jgi:hypothetical protein
MEIVTTTVRPCPTTLGRTTKLNMIDQIAPRDYVASYFFFRLPEDIDNTSVFHILEQGFHTAVQQFPDLMCCICKSEGGRHELELRLHEDSGATITMKDFTRGGSSSQQWTPGTFDDLERGHFPLQSLPQEHVLAQTDSPEQACLPTLAMQANFIDGGLILTGCLHVCIALTYCWHYSTDMKRTSIPSVTAPATSSSSLSLRSTSPPPRLAKCQNLSRTRPSVSSIGTMSSTPTRTSSWTSSQIGN